MNGIFSKVVWMFIVLLVVGVIIIGLIFIGGIRLPATVPNMQDENAVLVPPRNGADAQAAYQSLVEKLAQTSSTLEINVGCTMTPLVIKLTEGSMLAVHNKDTKSHVIAFEDQNFFSVSASQTREINLKDVLSRVAGTYRYRCPDISV